MSIALAKANEIFAPTTQFNPDVLLETLSGVDTIAAAVDLLDVAAVMTPSVQEPFQTFLGTIPASIDAAVLAAARGALRRKIPATFTWQAAAGFEVRIWDDAKQEEDGTWVGMVNVHLLSPDPEALSRG